MIGTLPERPWLLTGLAGYDPWAHLSECEGVSLTWHEVGPRGETDYQTQTISLRRGLTRVERRSTLAHELVHLERGPVAGSDDCVTVQIEEQLVELAAAVRMIPTFVLEDLPELIARHGEDAARDFLGVDEAILDVALEAVATVRTQGSENAS